MTTTTTATTAMQEIDINLVQAGERIRAVDQGQLEALRVSIADVGLLNPITVYRRSITREGLAMDGFGVIAGAHRLSACRDLGYAKIPAVILEMDELHRTIAECDENLCGTQLSPTERAEFTDRRKKAYELLHPQTRHGANQHTRSGQVVHSSFAEATAAATGQNARTVRRDAARATNIPESVRDMVKGTKLDRGTYLDQLKALPPSEQEQRVRADLEALEDERREKADAASAKSAFNGIPGKKGKKQKNPFHGPHPIADRLGRFASLVEELAAFTRAEFEEWRTDRVGQQAIKKALAYADSAAAMVRHFQNIHGEPKA